MQDFVQTESAYYDIVNFLDEVVSGDIMTPSCSLVEGCPCHCQMWLLLVQSLKIQNYDQRC
uniref:Putative ovule protein n=1 Tax=Solanum chacoense TaxID=4108 RepID=A0A0V0HUW7_SOLCH